MNNRDLTRRLIGQFYLLSILFPAIGCEMMHSSVPVALKIRDAETKEPIPAAEVAFLYPTNDSLSHERDSAGKSNPSGIVQLKAITGDDVPPPQVKVMAAGYLVDQRSLPGETLRAIRGSQSFWSFNATPKAPPEVAVDVYRGPGAVIELTLPVGYRGLVKAEVRIREDVVYQPRQRLFSGSLSEDGVVHIEGPPILRHEYKPDFRAKYTDETLVPTIPSEAKERNEEVGFRWLRSEGATEVFVVGTRVEWESYRRANDKGSGSNSSNSNSGGGGKGKRGGGGGGS